MQLAITGLMVLTSAICANAQWLNYPSPGTPLTRDGKPDLTAKAPRASNGKPDLSGVWQIEPPPPGEYGRLFGDPGPGLVVGDDPNTQSKYFLVRQKKSWVDSGSGNFPSE